MVPMKAHDRLCVCSLGEIHEKLIWHQHERQPLGIWDDMA